jgi:hypothetical protein
MGGGFLACGGPWVNEQLKGQYQACISGVNGANSGQCAASTVTSHSQSIGLKTHRICIFCNPLKGIPGIVGCDGKTMLGCKAVVHRNHSALADASQFTAQNIVRLNAANGESTPMEIHQRRDWRCMRFWVRRKQPGFDRLTITHRNSQVLNPSHWGFRQIQNAGRHFIEQTRLLCVQQVHRGAPCPFDVAQNQAHGFGQPAVGVVV